MNEDGLPCDSEKSDWYFFLCLSGSFWIVNTVGENPCLIRLHKTKCILHLGPLGHTELFAALFLLMLNLTCYGREAALIVFACYTNLCDKQILLYLSLC